MEVVEQGEQVAEGQRVGDEAVGCVAIEDALELLALHGFGQPCGDEDVGRVSVGEDVGAVPSGDVEREALEPDGTGLSFRVDPLDGDRPGDGEVPPGAPSENREEVEVGAFGYDGMGA